MEFARVSLKLVRLKQRALAHFAPLAKAKRKLVLPAMWQLFALATQPQRATQPFAPR